MTPEEIIALISLVVFLLIQTAVFGYYAGKMGGRVTTAEKDITENHDDLNSLGKKVESSSSDMFDIFVTNAKCAGLNKQKEIQFEALQKEREIYNTQNSKEHNDLLEQGKETTKALVVMSDCLHKLQNNKECN